MLQSPAFAPPPIPLSHYPKKENCRKEKQQVNGGERAERDVDHGAEELPTAVGRVTSLPHSTVAIPQTSG
jgi:hypothetical protein